MPLGRVIAELQDEVRAAETLAALGDWVLVAELRRAAEARGLSPGDYASCAVGQFVTQADDAAWLALMTAANGADAAADPAVACLRVMLEWALARHEPAPSSPEAGTHQAG